MFPPYSIFMKAKTKEKETQVLGLITRILIISIQILEQGPRTQKGSYVIKEMQRPTTMYVVKL